MGHELNVIGSICSCRRANEIILSLHLLFRCGQLDACVRLQAHGERDPSDLQQLGVLPYLKVLREHLNGARALGPSCGGEKKFARESSDGTTWRQATSDLGIKYSKVAVTSSVPTHACEEESLGFETRVCGVESSTKFLVTAVPIGFTRCQPYPVLDDAYGRRYEGRDDNSKNGRV